MTKTKEKTSHEILQQELYSAKPEEVFDLLKNPENRKNLEKLLNSWNVHYITDRDGISLPELDSYDKQKIFEKIIKLIYGEEKWKIFLSGKFFDGKKDIGVFDKESFNIKKLLTDLTQKIDEIEKETKKETKKVKIEVQNNGEIPLNTWIDRKIYMEKIDELRYKGDIIIKREPEMNFEEEFSQIKIENGHIYAKYKIDNKEIFVGSILKGFGFTKEELEKYGKEVKSNANGKKVDKHDNQITEKKEIESKNNYILDLENWTAYQNGKKIELLTLDETKQKVLEKYFIFQEISNLWLQKAFKVGMNKGGRYRGSTAYNRVFAKTDEIQAKVETLGSTMFKEMMLKDGKSLGEYLDKEINHLFDEFKATNTLSAERIIGETQLNNIHTALNSSENKQTRLIKIYNEMRKGWYGGGNSEGVQNALEEHLLQDKNFSKINAILTNPEELEKLIRILEVAENGWFYNDGKALELEKYLKNKLGNGEYHNLSVYLMRRYATIKKNRKKSEENLKNHFEMQLKKINEEKKKRGEKEFVNVDGLLNSQGSSFAQILKDQEKLQVYKEFRNLAIRDQTTRMRGKRGNSMTSYTALYTDVAGMGTDESWLPDELHIHDGNIDATIEWSSTILVSLASMGVGMLAINAIKWSASLIRLTSLAKNANNALKLGRVGLAVGEATIDGVGFHLGSQMAFNAIYGENLGKGLADPKKYAESIAFMGVLRFAEPIMRGLGLTKLTDRLPEKLFIKEGGHLVMQAGMLLGVSKTIQIGDELYKSIFEGVDFEWDNIWPPTGEEFVHLLCVLVAFKGAEKGGEFIKVKVSGNGKVGVETRK